MSFIINVLSKVLSMRQTTDVKIARLNSSRGYKNQLILEYKKKY